MISLGSIIGDIAGSLYERNNAIYEEDIRVFLEGSHCTDDSILTCAVAEWLCGEDHSKEKLATLLKIYAKSFPKGGYGGRFWEWVCSESMEDYGSYGNGSGMRVGPVGFYATTLEECLDLAKISAQTTHGHEEGIKGAQAIASAIFLARKGEKKAAIKNYIETQFGYNLDRSVDEIRNTHKFDATCQVTVPEAIICFLEGKDFVEVIKKCIWIGGDSDTIGAMAGPIAEAYYGIPAYLVEKTKKIIPKVLAAPLIKLNEICDKKKIQ